MDKCVCDNCGRVFDHVPIWVQVLERVYGPNYEGTKETPRCFCSSSCEEEHRKEYEVKVDACEPICPCPYCGEERDCTDLFRGPVCYNTGCFNYGKWV